MDWHIVLAPLLLLPIALLLRFAGCTAVLGDFTVAPPPGPALVKLNLDLDLQKPTPADNRKVKRVRVSWSLWKLGSVWKMLPAPPIDIVPTDALDDFLDPTRDPGAEYHVSPADLALSDHVSCTCEVTQGSAGGVLDDVDKVNSAIVVVQPDTTYVFLLEQKPPLSAASKRILVLGEYTPA